MGLFMKTGSHTHTHTHTESRRHTHRHTQSINRRHALELGNATIQPKDRNKNAFYKNFASARKNFSAFCMTASTAASTAPLTAAATSASTSAHTHTHINTEAEKNKRQAAIAIYINAECRKKSNKTRAIDAADDYAWKAQKTGPHDVYLMWGK